MLEAAPIGTHTDNFFGSPNFSVPADARRKHMIFFGATGTGKSNVFSNIVASDLDAGTGITMLDPHGGIYETLLNNHIPRCRKNDVILFDPKDRSHALALNVLDCPRPEERGLVVSSVVTIFNKLWASSWGARLEDILRNALWVLIEQPSPTSLLALSKLLTDDRYRAELLRHVENPAVLDFFVNTFNRWTPSFREEAVSPVLNKVRAFTTDPLMRATIGQTRSSFNFRWMMDNRKILLCDLAKGSIGDDNSRLLGSLIVLKERLAAASRQNIPEASRTPHVLLVDEAQNFIGDFESILAESRKYGLSLVLATQGTESLPAEAVHAVFTNCATIGSFRVSASDAERLAQEFGTEIAPSHLQDLANYTLIIRTLAPNPAKPKSPESPSAAHRVKAHPPFTRHPSQAWGERVVLISQQRFTMPREVVEDNLNREFFGKGHLD